MQTITVKVGSVNLTFLPNHPDAEMILEFLTQLIAELIANESADWSI